MENRALWKSKVTCRQNERLHKQHHTQRGQRKDSRITTMEHRSSVPTENYIEAREQVHSETLG